MNRKKFIQLSVLASGFGALLKSCTRTSKIKGRIIGPNMKAGHSLRDMRFDNTVTPEDKTVVIIGGGVSGLSAAKKLYDNGITDFTLLELETSAGGNSASNSNEISSYPLGAHYIPIPNNDLTELLNFLREAEVITDIDEKGIPTFNDFHLCADPEERLYINGRWQEGLIPDYGVPENERNEIQRFLKHMDNFRHAKGADGKDAFAIPIHRSSSDMKYKELDSLTMKTWLERNNYKSSYLHDYVNYCTRDDFGTKYNEVSAWAGIHYYAARKGIGSNATHSDVLTWPAGNGYLVDRLKENFSRSIKSNILVTDVSIENGQAIVRAINMHTNKPLAYRSKQCIIATPQFITSRLFKNTWRNEIIRKNFEYAPWMVANLVVNQLDERSGTAVCWDNVIAGSQSLGYVSATHQTLNSFISKKNLTYYLPLTEKSAVDERQLALSRTHEDWVNIILNDLQKIHPNIKSATEEVNITLWAHAMIRPKPGFIHSEISKTLSEQVEGCIHFAHTDLSGISIFEEAFYQGVIAANNVTNNLKSSL